MNNEKKNYPNLTKENTYAIKCTTCKEHFLGPKHETICRECTDIYKAKFKDITEEERKQISTNSQLAVKQAISFIKTLDKTLNGEFDESEEVVGINALKVPLLSNFQDIFYKGYLLGKHNEL